jgi:hypothetical protein
MAPADARGRHQGAVVMTFGAAQLVGPKLGCVAARGPAVLWGSCFVLTVVVGRALLVTARARGSRMARGSPTAVVESAPGVAKPAGHGRRVVDGDRSR